MNGYDLFVSSSAHRWEEWTSHKVKVLEADFACGTSSDIVRSAVWDLLRAPDSFSVVENKIIPFESCCHYPCGNLHKFQDNDTKIDS